MAALWAAAAWLVAGHAVAPARGTPAAPDPAVPPGATALANPAGNASAPARPTAVGAGQLAAGGLPAPPGPPVPAPAPAVVPDGPRPDELPLVPPPAPAGGEGSPAPAPAPVETAGAALPPALSPSLPSAPRPSTPGGTWAVIIGIDDYPGRLSDLRSAVADADDAALALGLLGVPAARRLELRNEQATAAAIAAAADWLAAQAGPDSSAVFFFSGHVRKLGRTTEAMIGADGAVVTDAELARRLAGLAAGQVWVAVAGCYGAGFTEVLAPGRVLTGAAGADALAFESSLYGRSYLVQFMIREAIIEGRAAGSVQAAFAYANRQLAQRHPGRELVQYDAAGTGFDLRSLTGLATGAVPPPPPAPAAPTTAPVPTPPRPCLLVLRCSG